MNPGAVSNSNCSSTSIPRPFGFSIFSKLFDAGGEDSELWVGEVLMFLWLFFGGLKVVFDGFFHRCSFLSPVFHRCFTAANMIFQTSLPSVLNHLRDVQGLPLFHVTCRSISSAFAGDCKDEREDDRDLWVKPRVKAMEKISCR